MKDVLAVFLIGPLGGFAVVGAWAWTLRFVTPARLLLPIFGYFILIVAVARIYRKWSEPRFGRPMDAWPRTRFFLKLVILGTFTGLAILGAEAMFLHVLPTNGRAILTVAFGLIAAATTGMVARGSSWHSSFF